MALSSKIPMRWIIGFPLFLLVLAGVYFSKKPQVKPADLFVTTAVRLSTNVLPTSTARDWNAELGLRLTKAKHYGAAKRVFEELLLAEPTNVSILNNIAYVVGEQGDFVRAQEYLQTAVQVSESCAECFNNLGTLLYKQGKKGEAKGNFQKALQVNANYIDAKLNMAILAEEDSDWAGALDWYKQAENAITDPEVKKWVLTRASWMTEIAQNAKRQVAGEGQQ